VEVGDSLQLFELGSDVNVVLASDDGRWEKGENLLELESGSLVGYPQPFVLLL
jgi:hypothetical protein